MAITFRQRTLPNGLEVIAEVDPDAHTAACGFFVKTGARDEAGELMGVSHFLEHMMFKGTEKRTADDVNQQFDDIGASHNAFTSQEMTAFFAHVLPEYLDQAEDILADIMRPALREEDFQQERGVILEEIAMYDDHPFFVLYEEATERYFGDHPLRHRVLGTRETIQALTRDQMQAYFDHRYSPDNIVVTYAGNVDFDQRVEAISQRCGAWQSTGVERVYPAFTPRTDDFTKSLGTINQQYTLMMAPAPAAQDDDRYAASMLAQVLGDAEGSRFYWALIETGLAEEAAAQYDPKDGLGEYLAFAVCAPDNAAQVEAVMRKEIDGLVDSLTEDDLVRNRAKIATAVTLAGERPAGRMKRLGRVWTYSREYRALEEELDRINAVTLDDLRRVAARFPLKPTVVGRLVPGKTSE